jgi:hypothetical protein
MGEVERFLAARQAAGPAMIAGESVGDELNRYFDGMGLAALQPAFIALLVELCERVRELEAEAAS